MYEPSFFFSPTKTTSYNNTDEKTFLIDLS